MCTVCTCVRFNRPQCNLSIWDNKACLTWLDLIVRYNCVSNADTRWPWINTNDHVKWTCVSLMSPRYTDYNYNTGLAIFPGCLVRAQSVLITLSTRPASVGTTVIVVGVFQCHSSVHKRITPKKCVYFSEHTNKRQRTKLENDESFNEASSSDHFSPLSQWRWRYPRPQFIDDMTPGWSGPMTSVCPRCIR